MGLAAKQDIPANTCFISIPNTCIVSLARVEADKDLSGFFKQNPQLFTKAKNADFEILMISTFLLREKLKGEKSFWHAYLGVMNAADLLTQWDTAELSQFNDCELECEVDKYRDQIEASW